MRSCIGGNGVSEQPCIAYLLQGDGDIYFIGRIDKVYLENIDRSQSADLMALMSMKNQVRLTLHVVVGTVCVEEQRVEVLLRFNACDVHLRKMEVWVDTHITDVVLQCPAF